MNSPLFHRRFDEREEDCKNKKCAAERPKSRRLSLATVHERSFQTNAIRRCLSESQMVLQGSCIGESKVVKLVKDDSNSKDNPYKTLVSSSEKITATVLNIQKEDVKTQSTNISIVDHSEGPPETITNQGHESHFVATAASSLQSTCEALRIPPELMVRIFAFFSVEELCRLGAVCRYWFTVAHDPLLWRRLDIRRQCPVESALGLLSYALHPETVHISNYVAVNTLVVSSGFLTSSLRCLDLGFSEMTPETMLLLSSSRLYRLAHLNLEGCKIVDTNAVIGISTSCPALERVTFSHCINVCDEAVSALCSNLTLLTHINLDGVEWVSDEGIAELVASYGPQLEAVWLDGANLTNVTIKCLCNCPRLRLLSIRFCETISDFITISRMTSLTSLTLRKASQVTSHEIGELLSPLRSKLSNLNYLDLSECSSLSDDDVTALAALCGRTLKHLVLDWCWEVTDTGLFSITEKCECLEWLGLAGLHNLSGIPLRTYPDILPRLTVLNLANCNRIQDGIIQALVDAHPSLIAFNYYGDRFETSNAERPDLSSEHDLWRIANSDYSRICQC